MLHASSARVNVRFIGALLARGVELRMVNELYSLRDAVVASTLQFSIIRICNAATSGYWRS